MSEEHDRVVTVSILESTLKSALSDLESRLEKRITDDGALTRAHFNIMVEKVNDSVRLVAEVTAHHSTVIDDHEARPQKVRKTLTLRRFGAPTGLADGRPEGLRYRRRQA